MAGRNAETGMTQKPWQGVLFSTVTLFLLWLILSGQSHPLHVGLGLVLSFGVAWLNAGADWCPRRFLLFRVLWYLLWLFSRIVRSGLHMTALILHPALPIAPRIIHYRTDLRQQAAVVLLGNSITLTPGTITAEVNDRELVVHAIDDEAARDLTSQLIEDRLNQLFGPHRGAA